MKAIMISDKPKWCALMMNGEKKIEVRKGTALYKATQKLIDEYGYAEFYVYCSKDENLFYVNYEPYGDKGYVATKLNGETNNLKGKVVFKFRCYRVNRIWKTTTGIWTYGSDIEKNLYKDSCLTKEELNQYFKPKQDGFNYKYGCAIHISDLEIFDRPRELSEFMAISKKTLPPKNRYILTKAPQNFAYIESEE